MLAYAQESTLLRARIHITRSKVLVAGDASSCAVLPVMTLNIRELAPFSARLTATVRFHASDPYVSMLQTAAL